MEQPLKESSRKSEPRGRSKTPSITLRVSVDRDVNGTSNDREQSNVGSKAVKKAPNVATIEEENTVTEKTGAGGTTRTTRKTIRTVTSDYSSDGQSPDRVEKQGADTGTTNTATSSAAVDKRSTMTTTTVSSTTISSNKVGLQQRVETTAKESRQNETNKVLEATQKTMIRTSTPKATSKIAISAGGAATQGTVEAAVSIKKLTAEELGSQHAAYKEYKEAGEYWNKYPKTDYTYSILSPHRREVAPGLIAMPNMSRPGLSKHAERINVMISRDPKQESYIRERYTSSRTSYATTASSGQLGGNFAHVDPYDSGEDQQMDTSQLYASRRTYAGRRSVSRKATTNAVENRSIISRTLLTIVNFFYSCAHSISRVFHRSEHDMYYTRIEDERGTLLKIYSFFVALVTSVFKKVYLMISSVLLLDTWLLQSAAGDVEQGRRKRRFLLILLGLLPFLLFGGIYLYLDPTPLVSIREHLANPLLDVNFEFKLPRLLPEEGLSLPDGEQVKAFTLEQYESAKRFAGDSFDSLKLLTSDALGELQKLWQENVNGWFY